MSDSFTSGSAIANGQVNGIAAGITATGLQGVIPQYGVSTTTQSGYYAGGNGDIEGPGATQVITCSGAVPSDPPTIADQYCNAVNFLATNPTNRPQFTIGKNDPLMQNFQAISQGASAILASNGMSATGTISPCVPVTTTTPAQYTTEMCSTAQELTTTQCTMGRIVNITDNTNYQCNQTINAYVTETCSRTLVVTIPPPIPATPNYNCTPPATLAGDGVSCVVPTIAATVNYSCDAGSTLNGSQCQPAPTAATPSYSCGSGQALSGTNCLAPAFNATLTYSCNSADTLSGSTCIPAAIAATTSYLCNSGDANNGNGTCTPAATAATVTSSCETGLIPWGNGQCQYPSTTPSSGPACTTFTGWQWNFGGPAPAKMLFCTAASLGCQARESLTTDVGGGIQYVCEPSTGCPAGTTYENNYSPYTGTYDIPACVSSGVSYSCPQGYSLGTGNMCYVTTPPVAATQTASCSSGTLAGSNTCQGANYSATVTYSCASGTHSGNMCYPPNYSATGAYSCATGTLSGTQCVYPTVSATVSYSCPTGTLSATSCIQPPVGATVSYTCPASDALNGTSCQPPSTAATITYTCAPETTLSGSTCQPAISTSWQDGCSAQEILAL